MSYLIKQAVYSGTFVKLEQLPTEPANEIALVGRSNVGKSSLINTISNQKRLAKSSSTPGKTRTINFYSINRRWNLVDLPGYGYAKVSKLEQHRWQGMLEKYLKKRQQLKGVVQLVDIRHEPSKQDQQMLEFLLALELPVLLVATKADKISRGQLPKQINTIKKALKLDKEYDIIVFSATNGTGIAAVVEALAALADPEVAEKN